MLSSIDTTAFDKIIVGRVTPTIYAFQTNTYPNYVKIGDTYRPVNMRLDEWRKYYGDLELLCVRPALLDSGRYFRDYAVHDFLVKIKHLERLREDQANGYYSREFFKDAKESDIDEAIEDIKKSELIEDGKYPLYSEDRRPVIRDYSRDTTPITLRNIQQQAVDNFISAYSNNRTNLLMYAVMRFGKSITAMSCAVKMKARLVVVLCGKIDVEDEWRRTVKKIANFDGYEFVNSTDLSNGFSITQTLDNGKNLVVFLSLQDLQGKNVKEKHKELFEKTIDLIIVDETHFGARADKYGAILRQSNLKKKEIEQELSSIDSVNFDDEQLKYFKYKVQLHLSGTPYRILMSKNEFKPEDVIAFYQYTDIIREQKKWDEENLVNDTAKEWNNPYYGFPQMIRFAFNPNKTARSLFEKLKSQGKTFAFAELLRPLSISKDRNGNYRKFKHETEILDLFEIIDGGSNKTEEGILSFLDYAPIKKGNMCRHMVIVLPFKASCDALEELFKLNSAKLPNISEYEVINIAGLNSDTFYPEVSDVKRVIKRCEENNQKTITLTVNRMLTGVTVEQWDTMIYLKDTISPQDYDQATFRIQNQYIKEYVDDKDGDVIKYNMKPQTLLVDFDPNRMMVLQELKSKFYNVNTVANGNDLLESRIRYELEVSPIITINDNKMVQVTAKDIMELVRNYSHNKSIIEEASSITFDDSLLLIPEILEEIKSMPDIDDAKGLNFKPFENDEDEDADDSNITVNAESDDVNQSNASNNNNDNNNNESSQEKLDKKLAAYYSLMLFFAFLTTSRVRNLRDMIAAIKSRKEDRRIANNIGLKLKIVKLLLQNGDAFIRSELEYAIDHINSLMQDEKLTPLERVSIAINKFNRISDSEVVTPQKVSDEIVKMLPQQRISKDSVFLDIASIQGEIAISLINNVGIKIDKKRIYSLPTSKLSYELTRKVYEVLDLPVENVLEGVYSSDFIGSEASEEFKRILSIKPTIIIGGPPFNSNDGGGRSGDSASALYHNFVTRAMNMQPMLISMFTKAVWYSGGKGGGLKEFRKQFIQNKQIAILSDYPDASKLGFSSTLRGGVCVFLWEKNYDGLTKVINHINNYTTERNRSLKHKDINILIRYNEGLDILDKVTAKVDTFYGDIVSSRNPFRLNGAIKKSIRKTSIYSVKLYDVKKKIFYIESSLVQSYSELLGSWKVLVAKASPGGDELPHKIISSPIVAEPLSACTEGLVVVSKCDSQFEAENLVAYMKTKFFRFMMILAKNAHNLTKDVYRFVPRMDLNEKWTDAALYDYFGITKAEQKFIDKVIRKWDGE